MAEDNDQERNLPASERKLQKAREEGQIPRSKELASAAVMLAAAGVMSFSGDWMTAQQGGLIQSGLRLDRQTIFDSGTMMNHLGTLLWSGAVSGLPLLCFCMVAGVAGSIAIGGWNFTSKAFMPDFGRLNPMKGLGNMFSMRNGVELIKASLKAGLLGGIGFGLAWSQRDTFITLATQQLGESLATLGRLLVGDLLMLAASLVLIAALDVPFQLWNHYRQMRMSLQELKEESKESEGDPHVKGQIKQRQREAARRRMMSAIPQADVIITNPTHFAVALQYSDSMGAPRVVAKGTDEVAQRIREIGKEHDVPLLEAPPLARALYKHTDIGDEIPAALYNAVAQVLAYVFQLRQYKLGQADRPDTPQKIAVPDGLDPYAVNSATAQSA